MPLPSRISRLSAAPMMAWTDRRGRDFLRLIDRDIRLYSEMIPARAVIHGDRDALLGFAETQRPVCLQLAGDDPRSIAAAAKIGETCGYDEINLNLGCPSPRATAGGFGAHLMTTPDRAEAIMTAMRRAVEGAVVSAKCRLGVDDQDPWETLPDLARRAVDSGIDVLIVHARKAWLKGLNPAANRRLPPLDYAPVRALKRDFPDLRIVVNGGLGDEDAIDALLSEVDGAMLGRAICRDPLILARLRGEALTAEEVLRRLLASLGRSQDEDRRLWRPGRFVYALFNGRRGARFWRRFLSESLWSERDPVRILREGLQAVEALP